MNAQITFVHALSPLHAGIGQGAGVIDLPIAREQATGIPYLPGSSLKGALNTRAKIDNNAQDQEIFGGGKPGEENTKASLAQFSDQRLLLLPVRSLAGTFAWVTSPFVLQRLLRDIDNVQTNTQNLQIPFVENVADCYLAQEKSPLTVEVSKGPDQPKVVYLEDLDLKAQSAPAVENWARWIGQQIFPQGKERNAGWFDLFMARFCLVHDDVLNFLLTTAIEVMARIRLKEDVKLVQDGGLWYEEALPAETVLSGLVYVTPHKSSSLTVDKVFDRLQSLTNVTIQFGGKATVGRGMCRVSFAKEGGSHA